MFKTAVISIMDQRGEEFSLILKVVIDGGLSELRCVNDGVDRCAGVARFEKLASRYIHNVITGLCHLRYLPVGIYNCVNSLSRGKMLILRKESRGLSGDLKNNTAGS